MESNRQYRFLVTGGGGYVGFHIALKLVELGHQVVLYDLNYPHQNWAEYQLQETSQQQSIQTSYGSMQFIQGDIRNRDLLLTATEKIDCVIHTVSYGMSGREQMEPYWDLVEDINVNGTRCVIDACIRNQVRGLVYTSTYNVVFGGQKIINGDESLPYFPMHRHCDNYSKTKSMAEQLVLANSGKGNFRSVALRLNGIFGPGEMRHIPRIINNIKSGLVSFFYFKDEYGSITDFISIENVVQGHVKAALKLCKPDSIIGGNAYFLSDGKPIHPIDYIQPLMEHLNAPMPKIQFPIWLVLFFIMVLEFFYKLVHKYFDFQPILTRNEFNKSSITHYCSIEKARKDLDYIPTRPNDISDILADLSDQHKDTRSL